MIFRFGVQRQTVIAARLVLSVALHCRCRSAVGAAADFCCDPHPVTAAGNLTRLIEEESRWAGIDPCIMERIRAGESGHKSTYDKKNDSLESSWGSFQLNRRRGLGVRFEKEIGLDVRNPETIAAQARWVAQYLAKGGSLGAWMGYHGLRDADPRWGDSGYKPRLAAPTDLARRAYPQDWHRAAQRYRE